MTTDKAKEQEQVYSMTKGLVRELCLRARDLGKYQEACFYTKQQVKTQHFDIWFEEQFNKIYPQQEKEG